MKIELTKERLEEIICCVVDNEMGRDEACDYAMSVIMECNFDDAEVKIVQLVGVIEDD